MPQQALCPIFIHIHIHTHADPEMASRITDSISG